MRTLIWPVIVFVTPTLAVLGGFGLELLWRSW
jgi:hypothetical protein